MWFTSTPKKIKSSIALFCLFISVVYILAGRFSYKPIREPPKLQVHVRTLPTTTFYLNQLHRSSSINDFYFYKKCNCSKHVQLKRVAGRTPSTSNSTCSEEADWLGKSQRIVSFGLFEDPGKNGSLSDGFPVFVHGILLNIEQVKNLYPGWTIRLYSNCELNAQICAYACMDELVWCDVNDPRFEHLGKVNPRMWRFSPIGDATVDIFVSRDLDSLISEREREAVEEWEGSNYTFHAMRDGHNFQRAISAGAWGTKNLNLKLVAEVLVNLRKTLFMGMNSTSITMDEDLLHELVFNKHPTDILVHDSYSCKRYKNVPSAPFPKKRKSRNTRVALEIGYTSFLAPECPILCRPSNGQNWTYC